MANESSSAAKPKTPRQRKPKVHPVVKWLRTVSIASWLLGLGGIVLGDWFAVGVTCIYLGFAALAVDVWFEPEFYGKWKWKASAWAVILAAAALFSWKMVFVPAPMNPWAFMVDGEYKAGETVSGIAWRPQFTEVQVSLPNPTDIPYDDVDIVVRPATAVAAIGQQTAISGVTIEDRNKRGLYFLANNSENGDNEAIQLSLIATDAGYRIRCPRIPANGSMTLVLGLVEVRWTDHPELNGLPLKQQIEHPNYTLLIKSEDFSTYWYGHPEGDNYLPRKTPSNWMKVQGSYVAAHRKRYIDQIVRIKGALKQP